MAALLASLTSELEEELLALGYAGEDDDWDDDDEDWDDDDWDEDDEDWDEDDEDWDDDL